MNFTARRLPAMANGLPRVSPVVNYNTRSLFELNIHSFETTKIWIQLHKVISSGSLLSGPVINIHYR